MGRRMARAMGLAALGLAVAGCEEGRRDSGNAGKGPSPVATPSALAGALGVDAAMAEEVTDPAAPAGDLKAEMARFKGLDACVKEHAGTDPLVGDSLDAIGYDTIIRDSCRVLEALTSKDAKRCDAIGSTALRDHCQEIVAIVFATPARCPFEVPLEPARGRSGACVALAARDPRLCTLEAHSLRSRCLAMLQRDPKACDGAGDVRARCVRDVLRYGSLLDGGKDRLPPLPTVSGTLAVTTDETRTEDVARELARGVVLAQKGPRWVVDVGRFEHLGASPVAPPPGRPARLAVRLVLGPDGAAEVERVELEIPKRGTLAFPGVTGAFRATYAGEKVRGGPLALTVSGKLGDVGVKLDAKVVVRDVVEDAASPRPGERDR